LQRFEQFLAEPATGGNRLIRVFRVCSVAILMHTVSGCTWGPKAAPISLALRRTWLPPRRSRRWIRVDFSLAAIRRFAGGVLYLAPEPDEPFRRLTLAIWERYPKVPPYGGKYSNIVPHLTVAQLADERQLDRIADQFARDSQGKLPIRATASEIALMEKRTRSWQARTTLALS